MLVVLFCVYSKWFESAGVSAGRILSVYFAYHMKYCHQTVCKSLTTNINTKVNIRSMTIYAYAGTAEHFTK